MNLARLLPLAALVALCVVPADAHFSDPRVRAFLVEAGSGGQRTERVSASGGGASAECVLSFETLGADEVVVRRPSAAGPADSSTTAAAAAAAAQTSVQQALAPMRGTCLTKQVDYWDYEVCLGASIKQFHLPDIYPLGHFSRWDGDTQLYDNGAPCEASADQMPRRVRLKFGCGQGAPFVASVSEVEVCTYEVIVGTPAVCRFPRFPRVTNVPQWQAPRSGAAAGGGRAPERAPSDGSEDWFLRLSQLPDGRFSCAAFSNEPRALSSKLHFGRVSLALTIDGLRRPAAVPAAAVRDATVVRKPGRVPAAAGAYATAHDAGGARGTVLRSDDGFGDGKLAFVEVFA